MGRGIFEQLFFPLKVLLDCVENLVLELEFPWRFEECLLWIGGKLMGIKPAV
jgi:hypothetical protein